MLMNVWYICQLSAQNWHIRDALVANKCNQQCTFSELCNHWGSIQVITKNVNEATQSNVESVWERTCTTTKRYTISMQNTIV